MFHRHEEVILFSQTAPPPLPCRNRRVSSPLSFQLTFPLRSRHLFRFFLPHPMVARFSTSRNAPRDPVEQRSFFFSFLFCRCTGYLKCAATHRLLRCLFFWFPNFFSAIHPHDAQSLFSLVNIVAISVFFAQPLTLRDGRSFSCLKLLVPSRPFGCLGKFLPPKLMVLLFSSQFVFFYRSARPPRFFADF